MGWIARLLRQKCVCWPCIGISVDGKPTLAAVPLKLKCRWEEVNEVRTDSKGKSYVSTADVFLPQAVPLRSYLWLVPAQYTDPTDFGPIPTNPETDQTVKEIRNFDNTSNVKNYQNNILYDAQI